MSFNYMAAIQAAITAGTSITEVKAIEADTTLNAAEKKSKIVALVQADIPVFAAAGNLPQAIVDEATNINLLNIIYSGVELSVGLVEGLLHHGQPPAIEASVPAAA